MLTFLTSPYSSGPLASAYLSEIHSKTPSRVIVFAPLNLLLIYTFLSYYTQMFS